MVYVFMKHLIYAITETKSEKKYFSTKDCGQSYNVVDL